MSRYCELRLIDVLKEEQSGMSKNKSKITVMKTFPVESRTNKTKLGNFPLLKRKNNSSCNATNDFAEVRETRLTKKLNTPTKSNIIQNVDNNYVSLSKESEPKSDITAGKRKGCDNKVKYIEEPPTKKTCNAGSSLVVSSNSPDKRLIRSRKRKRKSRESCWENKLTGARRVSKRLTNLRMEKQKSLKNLDSSKDVSQISIQSKQPINVSARCKMKSKKDLHCKPNKRIKASYYRNYPEIQFNFGKLSYTKRLYPKITTGRRPATYTVTIKPTSSSQQKPRKRSEVNEHTIYNRSDEDSNESDVNSLIECVEDIQDEIVNEAGSKELSDINITEEKVTDESNDQSKSKETGEEDISVENEVETSVCDSTKEEFTDDSATVAVDIESGEKENIECKLPEEKTINEHRSACEIPEKLSYVNESSKTAEPEDVVIINLKLGKNEDKNKTTEDNDLIIKNVSETEMKPETTNKECTTTPPVDISACSPVEETIEIINTED